MGFIVSMLLGGFAQAQDEGLTVLNAGWTVRGPEPEGGAALGVLIAVPREYSGKAIATRVALLDHQTGEPVEVTLLDEELNETGQSGPIEIGGDVVSEGTDDPRVTIPLTAKLAVNLPPFRLPEGREFRWQLYLDGETRPEWAVHFRTTPPELAQGH